MGTTSNEEKNLFRRGGIIKCRRMIQRRGSVGEIQVAKSAMPGGRICQPEC
jgi:hypothetical protein